MGEHFEKKIRYLGDVDQEVDKHKRLLSEAENRIETQNRELVQNDQMLKMLKFYNGFTEQQTHFINYIEECKRLEMENEQLKHRCAELQKETTGKMVYIIYMRAIYYISILEWEISEIRINEQHVFSSFRA